MNQMFRRSVEKAIGWVAVCRLLPALGLLLCVWPRGGEAGNTNRTELIRLQMINNMMYAADDFFGETRYLYYADQLSRNPPPTPPVVTQVTVQRVVIPASTDSKDTTGGRPVYITSTTTTTTGGSTGGGSSGGGTGGGGIPPDSGGGGDPGGGGCPT